MVLPLVLAILLLFFRVGQRRIPARLPLTIWSLAVAVAVVVHPLWEMLVLVVAQAVIAQQIL